MDPTHIHLADSAPYHDALAQCIDHWELEPEKTELLRDGVNHVFASERANGERIIVRISDGAIRTRDELEGELLWLDHLLRNGCTVTTPVPSLSGNLLETAKLEHGEFHVSCFERFGGRQLDPKHDRQWNDELFVKLGQAIGRIHRLSDELQLPTDKDRKPWYECEYSRIPDPLPDGFNPQLAEAMQSFTDKMRGLPTESRHFGLIHRDMHAGNFLVDHGTVQIIDFDLGGYGWRAMDFMVLLFGHYYYPSLRVPNASPELAGHVLGQMVRGYRQEYVVDLEQLEMISELFKLREIIVYVATVPALKHWQTAMGDPHPTVAESIAWLEKLWLDETELRLDLSQVQSD